MPAPATDTDQYITPDFTPQSGGDAYITPDPEAMAAFDQKPRNSPMDAISGFMEGAGDTIKSIPSALLHPFNSIGQVWDAQKGQFAKAADSVKSGNYDEALQHLGGGVAPIVGPMAADFLDGVKAGEDAYTLSKRLGQIVTFKALPQATKTATDLTRRAGGAILNKALPVDPAKSAAAQQVIDLGAQHGVTLTAGDISQRPFLKNTEVSLEKVPGAGMQSLRERQAGEVKAAAGQIASQYEQNLLETDPSSSAELDQAAQAGDQRARNVQEKMQQAGNDPDRIIQASIGLGDWTTRQTATNLYDRVQQLAEQHNLGDVPMDATGKAINNSLNQLMPAKLKNTEVIGLLQKIKQSISPQLDEEGNPVKPDNSYALIRQLHSDLGDRIREYYQGNNALIGEKGVGYLERAQNALEDDMRNYAANSNVPEIVDAGRTADDYYKTARVPYKNGMLASAATSIEPDQIFQQFIKAGKGNRAQNFYDALDDKGRAAVRYNMVNQAVENATNPQSGVFSPQKFFTAVGKLGDAYDVFFNAKDNAEIQGFKNLMGHVTRAGQYMENPPTGQRVIPYLMGGASFYAATHPMVAAGGIALIGGLRTLFSTVKGRDLLLRASRIKPGTPMMNSVWQDAGSMIGKGRPPQPPATGGAANPNQPTSP